MREGCLEKVKRMNDLHFNESNFQTFKKGVERPKHGGVPYEKMKYGDKYPISL